MNNFLLESKIINSMMQGIQQTAFVYRAIEPALLYDAVDDAYKELVGIIFEYHQKYKIPPSYEVLDTLISNNSKILLKEIKRDLCKESEIGYFLDELKRLYNLYLASTLSDAINSSVENENIGAINSNLKNVISKIERLSRNAVFSEGSFTDSIKERQANYIWTKENPNHISGVFSGYSKIDEYTFGIKKSEMMVIAGATSSGKSLLMMNMGINAWLGSNNPVSFNGNYKKDGKNVVYVTLEMSKSQLEQRVDACMARIKHRSIMRGLLTHSEMKEWERSIEFQKEYDKKFYVVDMPRGTKTLEIEAKLENIMAKFEPDLLCVDYLGIMKSNKSYGSDWQDVGHIAEDLHELCRKKNMPLITAAQRKGRVRAVGKNKPENIEDSEEIGRSKMVGDNANIILLIENRNEEHLREDMIIHVTKNRDGAKGKINLLKEFEYSKIVDMPENWTVGEEDFDV
jgi:replicative DNA helicase